MELRRQHLLLVGTVIIMLASCNYTGAVRLDPGLVGQSFSGPQKDAVYVEKGTGLPAAPGAAARPPASSGFHSFCSQVQAQFEPHPGAGKSGMGAVTLPSGTVQTPTAAYRAYTVQRGDTLSSIAARNGVRTHDLAVVNGLSANPNALSVGQVLRIPTASVVAAQASALQAMPKPVQQSVQTSVYVVQQGDTLSKIAARHGTTIEQLRLLNGFTTVQANNLRIGQPIKLPRK